VRFGVGFAPFVALAAGGEAVDDGGDDADEDDAHAVPNDTMATAAITSGARTRRFNGAAGRRLERGSTAMTSSPWRRAPCDFATDTEQMRLARNALTLRSVQEVRKRRGSESSWSVPYAPTRLWPPTRVRRSAAMRSLSGDDAESSRSSQY